MLSLLTWAISVDGHPSQPEGERELVYDASRTRTPSVETMIRAGADADACYGT